MTETVSSGGVQVKFIGLKKTIRALEQAGAKTDDLKDLMHRIGGVVVSAARPLAPRGPTGRLAASIRANRAKSSAVIMAGSARLRYVAPIHWGWPARNIRPQQFLVQARAKTTPTAVTMLDDGIAKIMKEI